MIFRAYQKHFVTQLAPYYDAMEAESFFYIVLEHLHGLRRIDLALNPNLEVEQALLKRWEEILSQLRTKKPIQYIIGETIFCGMPFKVNPSVLIPRPETEELVAWIISEVSAEKNIKILDIGTGSGSIAISLAKNLPNASVYALDVSVKALEVARQNAQHLGVAVQFIQADILQTDALPQPFDLIVSNPPYVRVLEKKQMQANVLDYEPHLALFVEDGDALLFYRKIAQLAYQSLRPGGWLFFEINQYLGTEMRRLMETMGFADIELKKDIYGNDRMLSCRK